MKTELQSMNGRTGQSGGKPAVVCVCVCVWTIPSQKLGVRLCFTVSQNKAKSFIFTLRCTII